MSISPLYGIYAAMAGLLAVGGALKVAKPADTANALAAAGLPAARRIVRIGGGFEALLGTAALLAGGPAPAAAVAVSYLGFTAFIVVALVRHTPISSCGCFGEVDAPPTVMHVVITATAAAMSVVMTLRRPPGVLTVLGGQPWAGIPLVALGALAAYLAYLVMAVLPRTTESARGRRTT
jgi:hypothetical protein